MRPSGSDDRHPSPPGRRTRLDPRERREQLVAVAARLFSEHGVDATSVSDIVAAAGVAQGTFYWYFPSKAAVLEAVADKVADEFASAIESVANDPELSADEKLRQGAARLMRVIAGEGRLITDFHAPEQTALHDRLSRATLARLVPPLTVIVAEGVAEGVFVAPDQELAAAMIAGALAAVDLPAASSEDVAESARHMLEFVLRGLGYPAG